MRVCFACVIFMFALQTAAAWPVEGAPELDAAAYPQDTPKNALNSMLKALEKRDFDYWLVWLIVPADTKWLIEKHGSLQSAALMNADDRHAPRIKRQIDVIKEILKTGNGTEGEDAGVKWARYRHETKILQMEKQPDGRWCMNIQKSNELAKEEAAKSGK